MAASSGAAAVRCGGRRRCCGASRRRNGSQGRRPRLLRAEEEAVAWARGRGGGGDAYSGEESPSGTAGMAAAVVGRGLAGCGAGPVRRKEFFLRKIFQKNKTKKPNK